MPQHLKSKVLDCSGRQRLIYVRVGSAASALEKMISQHYTYRYCYYYGPLSGGRDGRAMGCRELVT